MTRKNALRMPSLQFFPNEKKYVSPEEVSEEAMGRIKARKIGSSILGL